MATNRIHKPGQELSVVCSHPTTPTSGCPVRLGDRTGVALVDEGTSTSGETTVDFGPAVWDLPVKGSNASGNTAVAVGDALYYVDSDIDDGTGFLSKNTSGRFFGYALEAVNSGSTTTINVAHVDTVDPGLSQDPTNNVIQISKSFTVADMTDDGGTSGHIDFAANALPAHAIVVGWKCVTTGAFAGDTSAVVEVGKSGSLTAFSQTTNGSVFTTGTVSSAVPVATADSGASAVTPRVTITSASDFGLVVTDAGGAATVTLSYIAL